MSRKVLIGVGILAGVAIVAAIAIKTQAFTGDLFGRRKDVPTIMIVTPRMLNDRIDLALSDQKAQTDFVAQITKTQAEGAKPPAAASDQAVPSKGNAEQAGNLKAILGSLQDPLAGVLGHDFQASGRFDVVANSRVIDALADFGRGKSQAPKTALGQIKTAAATLKGGKSAKPGKADEASGSTATTQQTAELDSYGLTQVARKVGADYVLVASMSVPTDESSVVLVRGESPQIIITAQPIISYEIFDVRTGQKSFRRSEQLSKPVVEVLRSGYGDASSSLLAVITKLRMRLNQAASRFVLGYVLQEIAPARITKAGDQIVINRGANDGVQVGAVYQIEREVGDAVREGADAKGKGGRVLEKLRTPVGAIRIDRVQERVAMASVASGGPFSRDDVVLFAPRAVDGKTAAAAQDGGVALGSRALSQAELARSGTVLRQASVAIDSISFNQSVSTPLAVALASALQQDRRITVLSRADLHRVIAERQINAQSEGDSGQSAVEGLRTAGYLIVGEFRSSTSRRNNSISVGGESRVVSTSTSTQMSGTLRALSTDGSLVEAVDVSVGGGSLDALADAAARALLLKLFPMKVVQVDAAQGVVRLNRGEDAGLRAGSRVRLYSLGERIVDPQTGALLSEGARTYVGDIVLTDVEPGISTARFAGAPFPVAVGYAAQLGAGPAAASGAGTGGATAAAPRKAAGSPAKAKPKAEPEMRW